MSRTSKFWLAAVAILAIIGVVFVLITPAPDELPSTGPHSLAKTVVLAFSGFVAASLVAFQIVILIASSVSLRSDRDLLALTCTRIC